MTELTNTLLINAIKELKSGNLNTAIDLLTELLRFEPDNLYATELIEIIFKGKNKDLIH